MAVKITGEYIGSKKITLTHELSGTQLTTSAPLDNQGDGKSFAPTDLVGASLGACVLTIIAIIAERDGIDLSGMSMEVEKVMAQTPPRRIAELNLLVRMPARLSQEQRERFERAAHGCPVHRSLHPDVRAPISFEYV